MPEMDKGALTNLDFQCSSATAAEQVEFLNANGIGDGVKGEPYDTWESGRDIAEWTVNFNNGTTGMNCKMVANEREKYGDEEAAKHLMDQAKQ